MSIEKLIGDLIVALNANTAALQAAGAQPAAADKAPAKPAKPAAEKVEEKAPEQTAPTVVTTDSPEPPVELKADEVSRDKVVATVLALGKAGKRDALVGLLGEFNVKKAGELTDDQLHAFYNKANALLGG